MNGTVNVNFDINGLVETLKQLGIQIADASKPYVARLYGVYVKQAYLAGFADTIIGVIMLFAFGWLTVQLVRGKFNTEETYLTPLVLLSIPAYVGAIVLVVTGALHIFNPEYYAIQDIISRLTATAVK